MPHEPAQPTGIPPVAEERASDAQLSSSPDIIPPLIERSQDAFRRDLPRLLREHPRQWVAYHGDERVAVGPAKRQLYQECLRRGFRVGEFVVRSIEPEVPREVDHFNDV
jgi:hypothetical protein